MQTVSGIQKEKDNLDKLEHIQKRATKFIPELSKRSYSDKLKVLNLPTFKYRRYRGDMIEVFKKVHMNIFSFQFCRTIR